MQWRFAVVSWLVTHAGSLAIGTTPALATIAPPVTTVAPGTGNALKKVDSTSPLYDFACFSGAASDSATEARLLKRRSPASRASQDMVSGVTDAALHSSLMAVDSTSSTYEKVAGQDNVANKCATHEQRRTPMPTAAATPPR